MESRDRLSCDFPAVVPGHIESHVGSLLQQEAHECEQILPILKKMEIGIKRNKTERGSQTN